MSTRKAREISAQELEEAASSSAAVEEEMMMEEEEEEDAGGKRMRGKAGGPVAPPEFEPITAQEASGGKSEFRRVSVPPNRYSPLRRDWMAIYTPIVEQLHVCCTPINATSGMERTLRMRTQHMTDGPASRGSTRVTLAATDAHARLWLRAQLDVRMNPRKRSVELRTNEHTQDIDVLQKAADFLKAYMLGFEVRAPRAALPTLHLTRDAVL